LTVALSAFLPFWQINIVVVVVLRHFVYNSYRCRHVGGIYSMLQQSDVVNLLTIIIIVYFAYSSSIETQGIQYTDRHLYTTIHLDLKIKRTNKICL